jgi:hypothetical protein
LDLPTHFAFGIAIGFVFFGRPEIALLIGLGALLSDLDREYWFIPEKMYADEQIHRAGLHNVFIMAITYLVSPFLSLGVFLHVLQDSFTTVKDRGVEWFYPLTRLVKRGMYDGDGHPQPLNPKEHIYFYQEDPQGLVEYADPDLREQEGKPVPWRRVYGFAQNSHLLDRGFLFGSILVMLIWLFAPSGASQLNFILTSPVADYYVWGVGLASVVVLFLAGELDRRDKPLRLGKFNFIKYPLFALGLALLATWIVLYSKEITANLTSIFSYPVSVVLGIILIPLLSFAIIRWQTKNGQKPAVV